MNTLEHSQRRRLHAAVVLVFISITASSSVFAQGSLTLERSPSHFQIDRCLVIPASREQKASRHWEMYSPEALGIDSSGEILIPNKSKKTIDVYVGGVKQGSLKNHPDAFAIRSESSSQNVAIWGQYNEITVGKIHDSIAAILPLSRHGELTDFLFLDGGIVVAERESIYDPLRIRRFSFHGSTFQLVDSARFDQLYLNASPFHVHRFAAYAGRLITVSFDSVVGLSLTGKGETYGKMPQLQGYAGILSFDGKCGFAWEDDMLMLAYFDLTAGTFVDTSIYSFVEHDLNGKFGDDICKVYDGIGYKYGLAYSRGVVYFLATTKEETVVYRISLTNKQ